MDEGPRVVILGGGFAGLNAARSLKRVPVEVTILDRRNFHLFQPLLYQVAMGGLSPADISAPIRNVLRKQENAKVLLAEAIDFDPVSRTVILDDGEISYDYLVVAAGMRTSYFGNDAWEAVAPGLKSIEDATEIRGRVLGAFEAAEREPEEAARREWLTFVVVGGGPTGVELAGALAELARDTLPRDFRTIDTRGARVILVEGGPGILATFPPQLSTKAEESLRKLCVEVRKGALVSNVTPTEVTVREEGRETSIKARTILWAAGVTASPLGRRLAERTGAGTDRGGRVIVEPDFSIPGHPEVFVVGDLAHHAHSGGKPLPGVAPVAMQEGRYIARVIEARLEGSVIKPFRYVDKGNLATIGRASAVAAIWKLRFSGFPAWLVWLFVHLMYLIDFENRILVLVQWAWSYFTRNRSARLITGVKCPPPAAERPGAAP